MLESAQNLLEISKDEAKILKLQESVKTHQSNLDRIQEQLEQEKSNSLDYYSIKTHTPGGPPPPLLVMYEICVHRVVFVLGLLKSL